MTLKIVAVAVLAGTAGAQPATFLDLGVIGLPGSYTFNTDGSLNSTGLGTDTELAIWTSAGALLASDDDSGAGLASQIVINLSEGVFFLATSEFDSIFGPNFTNTGTGFEAGDLATVRLNINGSLAATVTQGTNNQNQFYRVEVVPAPASAALLGLGALATGRRRR
jgi:hypothetical protein